MSFGYKDELVKAFIDIVSSELKKCIPHFFKLMFLLLDI